MKFKVGDLVTASDIRDWRAQASCGSRYAIIKKVEWRFSVFCDSHREWLTLHLANGTMFCDFGYKFKMVASGSERKKNET